MDCNILQGDALELLRTLPPESVHTCVTSPPYYNLRDYGVEGQIGNEASVEEAMLQNRGASRRRILAIPADTPQSAYRRDTRKKT